jgi:hypothetical protein
MSMSGPAAAPAPALGTSQQSVPLEQQQVNFQAQQQLLQQQQAQQLELQRRQKEQQQQLLQQQQQQMQQAKLAQQQQGQHQHMPHQGLNGGWQSDKDVEDRRKMIAKM